MNGSFTPIGWQRMRPSHELGAHTSRAVLALSFSHFPSHTLFQQGGTEKLSEEAIMTSLEKVVELLAYISDKVQNEKPVIFEALVLKGHNSLCSLSTFQLLHHASGHVCYACYVTQTM